MFTGFYFLQLLHLVSLFYLFFVVFWPSKHSYNRFAFRISKNKYTVFVFTFLFTQTHPFSSVLSLFQFGQFVPFLDTYSVLHWLKQLDLSWKCQRQRLIKAKSTSLLNSETKVDLLRVTEIQFRIKITCHLQIKTFILSVK